MFKNLEIVFFNPQIPEQEFSLSWNLRSTVSGLYWQKIFISLLTNQSTILYPRFTGFRNSQRDIKHLTKYLNLCIDYINSKTEFKILKKYENYSRELLNQLHHQFELMRGPSWSETDFIKKCNEDDVQVINSFNYYIHEIEALEKNLMNPENQKQKDFNAVIVEFYKSKRFELPRECYDDFQLDIEYGDIALHYAQTGKTWLEVYLDKDEEINTDLGINPLRSLSGEFDIFFGSFKFDDSSKNELFELIKKRGSDPAKKDLALGYNVVGQLIMKQNRDEISHKLGVFQKVRRIRLFNGPQNRELLREFTHPFYLDQDEKVSKLLNL
ncbi:MAG: hypothetical protein OHK0056_07370 [Bacteriovoracaceae bacterium]